MTTDVADREDGNLPEDGVLAAQASVRRLGARTVQALLLAGCAGSVAVCSAYLAIYLNYVLELAGKLRAIAGSAPTPGGPDWFLMAVVVSCLSLPLLVLGALYGWYRRTWSRRLALLWAGRPDGGRLSRVRLGNTATRAPRYQERYLVALSETDHWRARLAGLPQCPLPTGPDGMTESRYRALAEAIYLQIEEDVAERALTTGLVVGVSQSRVVDHLTIMAASLELQLHVLSRLGKRPSLWSWYQLLVRAGSSVFANNYLNREDAFALSYTTKGIASGLNALSESLDDLDFEEAFDAVETMALRFATGDASGVAVNAALTLVEFGAESATSIGSAGLELVSKLIEKHGDDLFQGILAAGMAYYHGMDIAARCLALDDAHRATPEMTRTPFGCMQDMARKAGGIVLRYVRRRRKLLRDRRRKAMEKVPVVGQTMRATAKTASGMLKATRAATDTMTKAASAVGDGAAKAGRAVGGGVAGALGAAKGVVKGAMSRAPDEPAGDGAQ